MHHALWLTLGMGLVAQDIPTDSKGHGATASEWFGAVTAIPRGEG